MKPEDQKPLPTSPYPTQPSPSMSLPIASPKNNGPPKMLFIIPIVVLTLALIGVSIFGMSVSNQRNDYRDNVNAKIAAAVEAADKKLRAELEAGFLEREKNPYRTYRGPAEFGGVIITYPKTWSAVVDENGSGNAPVKGEFHPSFVPGEKSNTAIALRLEVIEKPYDDILDDYQSEAKKGTVRISPYVAPKVPGVLGARIDGEVEKDFSGSAVMFPVRDKTIRISTLSPQFIQDFDAIILANLEFTP